MNITSWQECKVQNVLLWPRPRNATTCGGAESDETDLHLRFLGPGRHIAAVHLHAMLSLTAFLQNLSSEARILLFCLLHRIRE